jgi:hypothetical protein
MGLSSWAKLKETFPEISTAPVAADAFMNSLRFNFLAITIPSLLGHLKA